MTTAELLKKKRTDLGLSLKQLEKKCGIRDTTLRKYENGDRNPKIETLEKIAAALGCHAGDLVAYEIKGDYRLYMTGEEFDLANAAITAAVEKEDREYIEKLSVPALKLNKVGRDILLDHAENLSSHEDLTR